MTPRILLTFAFTLAACGGCDDDADPVVVDLGTVEDAGTDVAQVADTSRADDVGAVDMAVTPDLGVDAGTDAGRDVGEDMNVEPSRVCEPDGLPAGTYDPDCVYLLGSLLPGSAGTDVFTYPGSNEIHYGFGNYASHPVIHPSDGRLMFGDFSDWFTFVPDAVRLVGDPVPAYPTAPLDNDIPVLTPHCDDIGAGTYRVWFFPDDAELAYACFNDNGDVYTGASTNLGVNVEALTALGPQRLVLSSPAANELSVLQGGVATRVTGIRDFERPIAGRWIDGRFVVALFHTYVPVDIEMYEVEPDGSANSLGVVAQDPAYESYFQECVFDPQERFHCFASPAGTTTDVIVAFSASAPPDEVWTEVGSPVAAHISYLATGP